MAAAPLYNFFLYVAALCAFLSGPTLLCVSWFLWLRAKDRPEPWRTGNYLLLLGLILATLSYIVVLGLGFESKLPYFLNATLELVARPGAIMAIAAVILPLLGRGKPKVWVVAAALAVTLYWLSLVQY